MKLKKDSIKLGGAELTERGSKLIARGSMEHKVISIKAQSRKRKIEEFEVIACSRGRYKSLVLIQKIKDKGILKTTSAASKGEFVEAYVCCLRHRISSLYSMNDDRLARLNKLRS